MILMGRWIIPVLVLPGTVLFFVPLAILWLSGERGFSFEIVPLSSARFWLAIPVAAVGLFLAGSSMRMFFRFGEGTAAPWDPPTRLVVRGVYRYVRNPMLSGVILLLIFESLFFQSWPLAIWAGVFFAGNAAYFPLFEEPGLRKRFGDDYRVDCENVGRWIPKLRPWIPPWDRGASEHG